MNPDRPTTEEVWRMLEAVVDPELHSSIVDLGMVRDVTVDEEGLVEVLIALTIAACPLRNQIESDVETRLRGLPGVTGVEVRTTAMTADERASLMARARKKAAERAPETQIPLPPRVLAGARGRGRHPDGVARAAARGRAAGRDPPGAGRPEGGGEGGRHGPPVPPEGGRRGREHDRLHLRPRPVVLAVRFGRRTGPSRGSRR